MSGSAVRGPQSGGEGNLCEQGRRDGTGAWVSLEVEVEVRSLGPCFDWIRIASTLAARCVKRRNLNLETAFPTYTSNSFFLSFFLSW